MQFDYFLNKYADSMTKCGCLLQKFHQIYVKIYKKLKRTTDILQVNLKVNHY